MRKTIGRDLPGGTYLEITAEERDGSDGLSAGFAISASGWERHGTWNGRACARNGRDIDLGGQCVEEMRRAAPELAPIMAVHLAGLDGTPMHAEANGWYFYSGGAREYEERTYGAEYASRWGTDRERAARALHIPVDELPHGLDREGFAAFVASLADRWAGQVAAARAVLADMVDGDGVEVRR